MNLVTQTSTLPRTLPCIQQFIIKPWYQVDNRIRDYFDTNDKQSGSGVIVRAINMYIHILCSTAIQTHLDVQIIQRLKFVCNGIKFTPKSNVKPLVLYGDINTTIIHSPMQQGSKGTEYIIILQKARNPAVLCDQSRFDHGWWLMSCTHGWRCL